MGNVDDPSSSTSLFKCMESRLANLKQQPAQAIFRVPRNLRAADPSAYEPMFVSIGPYHYTPASGQNAHASTDTYVEERSKLQQGQDLKWHFLGDFRRRDKRNGKVSLAGYLSLIQGSESETIKCYVENVSLGSDEFNQVMLLDACFILEFFFKETLGENPSRDYRQQENNMGLNYVYYDLLLLENQLPLFILEKMYDRFRGTNKKFPHSLDELVLRNFKFFLTNHFGVVINDVRLTIREGKMNHSASSKYYHLVHLVHAHLFRPPQPTVTDNSNYDGKMNHSASTLRAMGVKIVRAREGTSLFEIKFENGTLHLPYLKVFGSTSQVLRNFIAFEQTSECEPVDHYFSPCAFFMDNLIKTARDVETLKNYGVLTSHIGSNENVANLFNQIGIGCIKYMSDSYLRGIETQLEDYCQIRWHKWRAKAVDDYFSNPWSFLSLLAAIVHLVLTALQTIFTIFT